jgi:hypothetical protein
MYYIGAAIEAMPDPALRRAAKGINLIYPLLGWLLPSSIEEKIMKTMVLAAAAVLALGVGSAAYAGEGNGGASGTGLRWQARNGNATVPATEWFAATPAQRELLSHQYAGQTFQASGNCR